MTTGTKKDDVGDTTNVSSKRTKRRKEKDIFAKVVGEMTENEEVLIKKIFESLDRLESGVGELKKGVGSLKEDITSMRKTMNEGFKSIHERLDRIEKKL